MFPTLNVWANRRSKKNVIPRLVQCGPNGQSGPNVRQHAAVEEDKEVGNVPLQLSGMEDTFVKEETTMRKRLAMKM